MGGSIKSACLSIWGLLISGNQDCQFRLIVSKINSFRRSIRGSFNLIRICILSSNAGIVCYNTAALQAQNIDHVLLKGCVLSVIILIKFLSPRRLSISVVLLATFPSRSCRFPHSIGMNSGVPPCWDVIRYLKWAKGILVLARTPTISAASILWGCCSTSIRFVPSTVIVWSGSRSCL